MFPVLLNIGNFPVSSFGLFLALGIFSGSFAVWRIARVYEIDAEKILDLIILIVGVSLIFARIGFVFINLPVFDTFQKVFFLNRYPGLLFWGGFLGGLLALWWFTKKFKTVFLQAGDFAMVGFLLGAFFTEVGCLLGGCGTGTTTNLFIGVDQVGVIGKRVPIQVFEAAAFLIVFLSFWKTIVRFYIQGTLLAKGLIWVSLIKIVANLFKAENSMLKIYMLDINLDFIFPLIVLALGLRLYYQANKKSPKQDLATFLRLVTDSKSQRIVVTNIKKGWYNQKVNFWIRLEKGKKKLFKLLNIHSNPESF